MILRCLDINGGIDDSISNYYKNTFLIVSVHQGYGWILRWNFRAFITVIRLINFYIRVF